MCRKSWTNNVETRTDFWCGCWHHSQARAVISVHLFLMYDPSLTKVVKQVYKGVWNGELVAVKVCNQQRITERAKQQFQQEVSILHSCFHPNVVQFKGACCWKVIALLTVLAKRHTCKPLYLLSGSVQNIKHTKSCCCLFLL